MPSFHSPVAPPFRVAGGLGIPIMLSARQASCGSGGGIMADQEHHRADSAESLSTGDCVLGTFSGEVGVVLNVEGPHILRIDSSGKIWSSSARLWRRRA